MSMSEFRPILPSPNRFETRINKHGSKALNPSRKRNLIRAACEPCRLRKSKCDGMRPTCSTCTQREEANCYYNVEDGITRSAATKQQVQNLKDIITGLCCASDTNSAIAIASQLQANGFCNLEEIASMLRCLVPVAESSTQHSLSEDIQDSYEVSHTTTAPSKDATRSSSPRASVSSGYVDSDHLTLETPRAESPQNLTPEEVQRWSSLIWIQGESRKPSEANCYFPDLTSNGTDIIAEPLSRLPISQNRYWFVPQQMVNSLHIYGALTTLPIIPLYIVQIANSIDKRYISARYTDFVSKKRRLIENGYPAYDALGPSNLEPAKLLNTKITADEGLRTVCEWAIGLVQDIDILCLAEKLATIFLIAPLARWQISPTMEHYHGIAACMKPTPLQVTVPHPAWIDYVQWPDIRDYFITSPTMLESRVLLLLARCAHIHWAENMRSMITICPVTNTLVFSDEFEAWVIDINHWSLDHAILSEFPALASIAWIKDSGESRWKDLQDDMKLF